MTSNHVWFWQRIVSPHMAGLAEALAAGGREVTYVAEQPISTDRAVQGWQAPELRAANLRFAPDAEAISKLVAEAPERTIHICQGFRGNGLVGQARTALGRRGLRQWVIMEMVEERGWPRALTKRLAYRRLIQSWRYRIEGILAIGQLTPDWLVARGMPSERVFPFAYFLPEPKISTGVYQPLDAPFRVLFVGQIIERKRLDLLIGALSLLNSFSYELVVIGSGPLEAELRAQAADRLAARVVWLGRLPMNEIPMHMAAADCLVLPSRHDGWGVVVSEALMVGTPVICSDRCGAAIAVQASRYGGVFPSGDVEALAGLLRAAITRGRQTREQRAALATWARCLGATVGAAYLNSILLFAGGQQNRPSPPWSQLDAQGDQEFE